jgi:hypothetical protein
VRHTDRLWRSTEVEDRIIDVLHRSSVELWDFGGHKEFKSAGGRFALKVLGAAAELEKNLTGERIREMKRGKAKSGKLGGGPPPYGYTSQSRELRERKVDGLGDDEAYRIACDQYPLAKTWYFDEREVEIVRLIFDLYLNKRWGARRISEELNRRGHRRRSGLPWVPVKVGAVLNNPAVAGFTSYDEEAYDRGLPSTKARFRQTLFDGTHTAIIEPPRWHEAQRLKTEVNAKRLRTKSASSRCYPLTGVLRCSVCGSPMSGKSNGTRSTAQYVCNRRRYYGPKDGCNGTTVHQKWAEETVWNYLDGLLASPNVIGELVKRVAIRSDGKMPEFVERIAGLQAEIAGLDGKQRRWIEKYEDAKDEAAAEVVWARIHELKTRQLNLKRELEGVEQQLSFSSEKKVASADIAMYVKKLTTLAKGSSEKRKTLIERLEQHHDLRVRVVDQRRLAVSFRLDTFTGTTRGEIGSRVVMVGAKASPRRMSTRSPVPGGPDSSKLWPPATAISIA